MKKLKYYGRKDINKLDWLLACICVLVALASIWLSIGLSIANAGRNTVGAFVNIGRGLGFQWGTSILTAVIGAIFYYALIYSIVAIAYLIKKKKTNRIAGVVATFVALVGFIFFIALFAEFAAGAGKDTVKGVWVYGELIFLAHLAEVAVFSIFAVWSPKFNIELKSKAKQAEEEPKPVEKKEEVKEVVKEEPKAEEPKKVEEPKEEPRVEEKVVEVSEEEDEEGFKGLGPRRRRIPFESKLKKVDHDTYERYSAIVEALREYKLNDRISVPGETFSYKKQKLVFLTFSGNTLKAYMALDPKEFADSPIPVKDMSEVKKFEQTPCMLVVKSDLASRRVIDCCKQVFQDYKVPRNKQGK